MPITITVAEETLQVANKVGVALIEQYAQRFADDPGYVLDKADDIKNLSLAECLMHWFQLDHDGRDVFAEQLGMPIDLLEDTCEGIKWIMNH